MDLTNRFNRISYFTDLVKSVPRNIFVNIPRTMFDNIPRTIFDKIPRSIFDHRCS